MDQLWDLIVTQFESFNEQIGPNCELAVCLPGLGLPRFFPRLVEEINPQIAVLHGELDSGEKCRIVFTNTSFPIVLIGVPKPQDQPKRTIGFKAASEAVVAK